MQLMKMIALAMCMFLTSCASMTEPGTTRTEIICAGKIVTWNSLFDKLSSQTMREILDANTIYENCKSGVLTNEGQYFKYEEAAGRN